MSTGQRSGCGIAALVGGIIGLIAAAILILFGLLWMIASSSPESDPGWFGTGLGMLIAGLVLVAVCIVVILVTRPKKPVEIVQKVDLTGDVGMAKLKCKNCGADLDQKSITLREGAIFVSCPYCGSTYQMVEEPKW